MCTQQGIVLLIFIILLKSLLVMLNILSNRYIKLWKSIFLADKYCRKMTWNYATVQRQKTGKVL